MSNALPWGKCLLSPCQLEPPHLPGRGIVGHLVDKCIISMIIALIVTVYCILTVIGGPFTPLRESTELLSPSLKSQINLNVGES